MDKILLDRFKVCYQPGKGRSLVPLLMPDDTFETLHILADPERRRDALVSEKNPYLFAPTNSNRKCAHNHVQGWSVLKYICKKLDLQNTASINFTGNRHHVSTYFASLELTQKEKDAFYDHMGHSADVNKDNYQCPPAVRTITTVGKRLLELEGILSYRHV